MPAFLTRRDAAANTFERWLTGEYGYRKDCPEMLPLPELPSDEEIAPDAHRALDAIQKDMLQGLLRLDPNASPQGLEKIAKQHEADAYVREVIEQYLDLCERHGGFSPTPQR